MNSGMAGIKVMQISIKLTEWQDWKTWYEAIRQQAESHNIWHIIDPEGTSDEPEKIPEPENPKTQFDIYSDMSAKDAQRYDRLSRAYSDDIKRIDKRDRSLREVGDFINSTLSSTYLEMISSENTLKDKLRILKTEIEPSNRLMRTHMLAEYKQLKATPYGQSVATYLQAWINLGLRDKTQPVGTRLFTLGEEEPCDGLATALRPLYQVEADFRMAAMTKALSHSLTEEISFWKELLSKKDVSQFPAKTKKIALATASATLKGQDRQSHSPVKQNLTRKPPRCICGNNHQWFRCYYLNKDYPRPAKWSVNRAKKASIQKQLNLKPDLQAKINANIATWKSTQPQTGSYTEASQSLVKQQNDTEMDQSNDNENYTFAAISLAGSTLTSSLKYSVILDQGSNVHIVNKYFQHRITIRRPACGVSLQTGSHTHEIHEIVTFMVYPTIKGSISSMTLCEAFYIPDFMTTIVSGLLATNAGIYLDTSEPDYLFTKHGNKRRKACGITQGPTKHFILETIEPSTEATTLAVSSRKERKPLTLTTEQWHKTMGHPSKEAVNALENNTTGSKIKPTTQQKGDLSRSTNGTAQCDICIRSKAKSIISRRNTTNREVSKDCESNLMAIVSWDLIEMLPSMPDPTKGNLIYRYYSHYYYDNEGYHVGQGMATKDQAAGMMSDHFKLMGRIFKAQTILFRSDLEGSLGHKSSQASKVFNKLGIMRLPSAADTPAQNGAAEASGNAIVTKARCLRIDSGLPKELWPWLLEAAIYLLNRTPTKRLGFKTPFEMVTGVKPFIGHLHPIGCKAFAVNKDIKKRDKLEDRAHIGYNLGYAGSTNIFYVYIPKIRKVIRTRDVYFKDEELYSHFNIDNLTLGEQITQPIHQSIIRRIEAPEDDLTDIDLFDPTIASKVPVMQISTSNTGKEQPEDGADVYPTPPPTREQTQTPEDDSMDQYEDAVEYQTYSAALIDPHTFSLPYRGSTERELSDKNSTTHQLQIHQKDLPPPPTNWNDMINHKYASEWKESAQKEMDKLYNHGTFEKIKDYDGYKLKLKWVFTYKVNEAGYLLRFKARLCVRGDLQLPTVQETYAATLAYKVLRFMCAMICAFDLNTMQFDVVNAFPHAELDKKVYCSMPPGMEEKDICLLLKRALYGLAESPRLWYNLLVQELEDYGFNLIPGVRCLMEGHGMWILFYVDDIILIYWPHDEVKAQQFREYVSKRFEITYAGEAKWFLGLEIRRDRVKKKLWLSQKSYIEKLGTKFNITGRTKYSSVPIPPNTKNVPNSLQASPSAIKGFQIMVGSIGHAAIATRPDIAKAHTFLAQYLQNPSDNHLELTSQTLSYLYGSKEHCLMFDGHQPPLEIYCDASFADNSDRKSSHGFLVQMYGAPVEWKATKQKTITTSTTEAELLALSTIAGHAYWWRRLFEAINFRLDDSVYQVFCDNERAVNISNCKEDVEETAMRHVDIRQQWIRQETTEGRLKVSWIPTRQQKADGLTKHLSNPKFEKFREDIGIQRCFN